MTRNELILDSKILIVDDKEDNVLFLKKLLNRQGFSQVLETTDARKALTMYTDEQPDLIMLDLMMPHLSGFEVMASILKQLGVNDYLPIIVLTADTNIEARHRALNEGAMDFLTKPLDAKEVMQRTSNLLHTRVLHQKQKNYNRLLEKAVQERTEELHHVNVELKKVNHALRNANAEVLERLAQAAEYRDDDTGKHTQRVGKLSASIATELNLGERLSQLITQAARLHDVGKIAIPDTILLKAGALTPDERRTMQNHCEIGANLLQGGTNSLLIMAERIALTHHERWDGTGYPAGLSGANIPIEGRIVAIVDVYDALTNSRPYKKAWPQEKALELIRSERGKHFDPEVTDAFLTVIQNSSALV